jgi:desulfoferrodoxin-like iron-binding protein
LHRGVLLKLEQILVSGRLPAIGLSQATAGGATVANETGKRYACPSCGAEVIVTKGGDGQVRCCGDPMARK